MNLHPIAWLCITAAFVVFWGGLLTGCVRLRAAYKHAQVETFVAEWGLNHQREIFQPQP